MAVTPIQQVEYLTLDGRRYRVREGRFTRSHLVSNLDQFKASRADSPFLDGLVTSFGGGVKPEQLDDAADWVAASSGLEPCGPASGPPYPRLQIGKALGETYSVAGAGVLLPLASDHGYIFAGEQGSDKVLNSSDGTTWSAVSTGSGSTAGVAALLARHVAGPPLGAGPFRRVWASFYDDEHVYRSDDHGATWDVELTVQDLAQSGGGTVVGVADAVTVLFAFPYVDDRVYAVAEGFGDDYGRATIGVATDVDDPAGLFVGWLEEEYCRAGAMVGDVMWLAGADVTDPVFCTLYTYDRADTVPISGVRKVTRLQGNYFTSGVEHEGATYWGGALRGELYACDGTSLELFHTFPTTLPIRGLCSLRGFLHVGIYNDADDRLEVWRWDGTAWSVPHVADATLTAAGQLVEFDERLHVAAGNGTTRKVYAVSDTDYATATSLTLPDAVYGAPTAAKRYRRVELQHGALQAGQSVEALYSLDGGAAVSLGTNARHASTRTAFDLPEAAVGGRLSARFDIANDPALTLMLYGGGVRALPASEGREVWEADLILGQLESGAWADAVPDDTDAIARFDALAALHDGSAVFEALDPFRDANGTPRRAMLAVLDPQVPFGATFNQVLATGAGAEMPVRLLQAGLPQNLVANGSFEQDAVGDHPTGWALSGTVTAWQTESPGDSADGVRVLGVAYDGAAAAATIYQGVRVVPGRWYTLSGYIKRSGFGGVSPAVFLCVIEAAVSLAGSETEHLGAGTDAFFKRYSATFRVPVTSSGSVSVAVYGGGTPNGGVYVDAIQLEAGAPASAFRERGAGA